MNAMTRLLAEGRIKEASEAATRHLAQHPNDEEALIVSAKVALVEGRPAQAEQLLTRVKSPQVQQEVTLMRAAAALQRQDWTTARTYYQSLTTSPKPPAEAWHGLGVTLLAQENPKGARDAHERAVALNPKQPGFRYELGRVLVLLKQWRAGAHQLVQSLRLEPKNEWGYWALAYLLHERGKARSARRIVEAGLKQLPQSKLLRETLGGAAGPSAAKAGAADPHAAVAEQAMALLGQKRAREARKVLSQAAEQGKRSVLLKLLEAEACKGLVPPDSTGAIKAYEEALALEPGNWVPHNDLALFLLEEGMRHLPRAIQSLEEARKLAPAQPEPALNLVVAYGRAKRIPDALALVQKVLADMTLEPAQRTQAQTLLAELKKA